MNKLVMLVSILRRNLSETAVSFLNENGISVTLGRYGRGTATKEIFKIVKLTKKDTTPMSWQLALSKGGIEYDDNR